MTQFTQFGYRANFNHHLPRMDYQARPVATLQAVYYLHARVPTSRGITFLTSVQTLKKLIKVTGFTTRSPQLLGQTHLDFI